MSSLYLHKPTGDRKYCLCFKSNSPHEVQEFKVSCMLKLDFAKLQPIHQCDQRDFQMFEFWDGSYDNIVADCRKVAEDLNMELELR